MNTPVMVRAFRAPVRGLFNRSLALVHSGVPRHKFHHGQGYQAMLFPARALQEFKLFFARTQNERTVEMRTDGNGTYTLEMVR